MTNKDNLQKEIKDKVKEGIKPSDLKKLKRSKSLGDIPTPPATIPLKKSQSHLEIPLANQPSLSQQIKQLKQNLLFAQNTADNYLRSLQTAQAQIIQLQEQAKVKTTTSKETQTSENDNQVKIKELEDKILQLRLDKIKEFGDYLEKKQDLETELELNINSGIKEIQRLESKLNTVNKKKLELQQQLGQSQIQNAQLEMKLLEQEPAFNYWPVITIIALGCLSVWLLSQNTPPIKE